MTRPNRIVAETGLHTVNHVYERRGRSDQIFDQKAEAVAFVSPLRDVGARDDLRE
jgi:hypothetical protein